MERVKKGERYWYIILDDEDGGYNISFDFDDYTDLHDVRNRIGNYFHTKEEAEAMAKKLRAVLNGADVIEMPSEKELHELADNFKIDRSMKVCKYYHYGHCIKNRYATGSWAHITMGCPFENKWGSPVAWRQRLFCKDYKK